MPVSFPAPFPSSSTLNLHSHLCFIKHLTCPHTAGDFPACHHFSTYIFMVFIMLSKSSNITIMKHSPQLSAFLPGSHNSSKSSVTNFGCCAAFPSSPRFHPKNIFILHSLMDHSKASITTSWVFVTFPERCLLLLFTSGTFNCTTVPSSKP